MTVALMAGYEARHAGLLHGLLKIREMHKQNKKELSRASLSGDDDLLTHHGGPEVVATEEEAKRVVAAAYDYEADPRWADYWSDVLVSPHLATRPGFLAHFRCKFYQSFTDRDLVVEPMSTLFHSVAEQDIRGYLEEPCLWVETNNTTLSLLCSKAELALGFLLIISLWRHNFIQTFMYWDVLKMMYRAPVTSSYHQSAWAKIGRTVNPYIDRCAPFLQTQWRRRPSRPPRGPGGGGGGAGGKAGVEGENKLLHYPTTYTGGLLYIFTITYPELYWLV
ncbi:hypothetical protein ZWY2020_041990 [Hordeum vulgare]|nr:hypothetical protein ZWY2020_041990 [Hordeum vulgare]